MKESNVNEVARESKPTRKVGFILGLGILIFPYIFAWFTLRKGYTIKSRCISLFWMSMIVLGIIMPAPELTPEQIAERELRQQHQEELIQQKIAEKEKHQEEYLRKLNTPLTVEEKEVIEEPKIKPITYTEYNKRIIDLYKEMSYLYELGILTDDRARRCVFGDCANPRIKEWYAKWQTLQQYNNKNLIYDKNTPVFLEDLSGKPVCNGDLYNIMCGLLYRDAHSIKIAAELIKSFEEIIIKYDYK